MAQIKDIFSRLYKLVFDIFFYSAVISVILGLLPDHLFTRFSQFKPVAYTNDHLFRGLEGQPWNDDLVSKAKLLGVDELYGPESLHVLGEYVYTGLADGRLVRIHKDSQKIEEIVNFGNPADGCAPGVISKIIKCGRILGLRHHTDGHLYLVESGSGVYKVNVSAKTKEHIKWKGQTEGSAIYNDLVFDPLEDGLLYVSVSTAKWNLDQIAWSIVEHDTTGYVMAVDLKSGKASKVTDGHALLNGVEISADKKHLLFSVTNDYAIKKIPLKDVREAVKSGTVVPESKVTLFGRLLPGEPDNIRLDESTGDILVGMFTTRPDSKLFRDYLTNWPFTRKALARTAYTLSVVLQYVHDNLYPNHALEALSWDLYSGHIVYKLLPKRDGAVIKLDGVTGQVKRILGSSKFNSISEAIVDAASGDLYYGSFRNTFIGRIKKGDH